ncbi:MAG: branched-chain amino acid ABC transporter permease [Deltaproteobacteria bacterium]|nr:branched-chain amino acid ABC transporter permease [Deltaproteobacteria bacterium]
MAHFLKDRFTIIVIIFVILPFVFPFTELATEILIFALLAVAFNLMLGYAGLLSFCHASLFASGAYTMGILLVRFDINIFLGMLSAAVISALIALVIGWVAIRRHGIYFAMLTLAFNEVIYFTIFELKDLTGGDDGLRGVFRPDVGLGPLSFSIHEPMTFYFFVLVIVVLSILAIRRITDSPFGSVFLAIRENENRAESVGYKVRDYKIVAFVVSGFFSGIAGALFCMQIKYVALSYCHWSLSGEVIMMSLVGGIGSLYGPIIGAGLVTVMQDFFSTIWDRWLLILGAVFVIFVMFFQGGVWEGIESLIAYYSQKFGRKRISE